MQDSNGDLHNEATSEGVLGLLFQSKSSSPARPFDNIPDLGRAIANLPGSQHVGKEAAVTSFLRQVFNGQRSCSNEYMKLIVAAVRLRAVERNTPDSANLTGEVEKAIQALKKRRDRHPRLKHGFGARPAHTSNSVALRFVINPPLREITTPLPDGKPLSQLIAENIEAAEISKKQPVIYKLCFTSATDAVDFLRLIFADLQSKNGEASTNTTPDIAANIMARAEAENLLQVYIIPYYLCLTSALIDNPDSRDDCQGVTMQLEKSGQVRIYPIAERNITYWRQMYYDLENGVFGDYSRIEFEKYRNLIVRR